MIDRYIIAWYNANVNNKNKKTKGDRKMCNEAIRNAAKEKGVKLWEIAQKYGISDGNFSRKLRKELSSQETERILQIITDLSEAKEATESASNADD